MQKVLTLFFLQILLVSSNSDFLIQQLNKFPFPAEEKFELEIILKSNTENIKSEIMVIGIIDENNSMNERAIFNYGKDNSIKEEFYGINMEIPVWLIDTSRNSMKINILFKRNSHGKILKIFSFQASTKEYLKKVLNDLSLAKIIFTSKIDLLIPPKLEISMKLENNEMRELNEGDLVVVTCRAYNGIPLSIPSFENYRDFNITKSILIRETNERKIWFRLSLLHHSKLLQCNTGNSIEKYIINVPHFPTKIFLKPKIEMFVKPGTVISCYVKDGYPEPNINWEIIEGPKEVTKFFSIIKKTNRTEFQLNDNNKSGFNWKIKCTAENVVKNSKKIVEKIISFTTQESPVDQCDNACLHLLMKKLIKSNEQQNSFIKTELLTLKVNIKNLTEKTNINDHKNIIRMKQNHDQFKDEIQKLKSDFQTQLTLLKHSNVKTFNEFKQNIDKMKIGLEKLSVNNTKEIIQMKIYLVKSISNLEKMKNQENNSLKKSIQKLVRDLETFGNKQNIDIKNLKKEMIKEHKLLKSKIDMLKYQKTTPSSTRDTSYQSISSPTRYNIHYKINNLSIVRKSNQNLSSNDYSLNDLYTANIQIWFRDLSNIELLKYIEIFLLFQERNSEDIKATLKIKMTIEIANSNNSQLTKTLTKIFTIQGNEYQTPTYQFNYQELSKLGVLLSDSITINCLIIIF